MIPSLAADLNITSWLQLATSLKTTSNPKTFCGVWSSPVILKLVVGSEHHYTHPSDPKTCCGVWKSPVILILDVGSENHQWSLYLMWGLNISIDPKTCGWVWTLPVILKNARFWKISVILNTSCCWVWKIPVILNMSGYGVWKSPLILSLATRFENHQGDTSHLRRNPWMSSSSIPCFFFFLGGGGNLC